MSPLVQTRYTPEQYLARERAAETRNELVNGQIYAMTGASHAHNVIVLNIGSELRNRLRGRSCVTYVNDMRVKVPATMMYAYPDVVAVCEPPRLEDEHGDTLLNPAVIFEVLSDTTESYDRGAKFAHYRRLDSLREYILVSQDAMRVEQFVRSDEHWVLSEVSGPDGVLRIEALGCELPLREVYDGLNAFTGDMRHPFPDQAS